MVLSDFSHATNLYEGINGLSMFSFLLTLVLAGYLVQPQESFLMDVRLGVFCVLMCLECGFG